MADIIEIQDLLLRTIVGINPEERENPQDVLLRIRVSVDLRSAGRSDDIEQTLNYRTLCKRVIEHVSNHQFLLIERVAEDVAGLCLSDPRCLQAWVRVEKPGALRFARTVAVEIERTRANG